MTLVKQSTSIISNAANMHLQPITVNEDSHEHYTNKDKLLKLAKINQQTLASEINYYPQDRPERAHLETFIKGVYKKYYDANIEEFYPNLLAIETNVNSKDNESTIKAVAGVRSAENGHLFSEYYLKNTLEQEIKNRFGASIKLPISRKQIVEVGNLAPANIGQMRWLITSITGFLYSAGFKYLIFTGVSGIYNSFSRMNIPLELIAEAKQDCLPEEIKKKWGPKYYQNKPMVFLGDIEKGYEIMKKNIYSSNKKLIPLFEQACKVGAQALLAAQAQEQSNETEEFVAENLCGEVA
ncbi:thermostable hemolysin [sulfur-oxidizing endosymbiont of Gigantopelta aegis]|uniref:thermostable hemolysin n=1 Tax=sulfur-oxidizing endosymbiont of Gigantopelta aegis TaxID=2794934 RepID=UPI0018DE5EF3|nr:thermostable hemolysin [sulfur-oxidizing endosymbiont of Gigantopelta aegis]